MKKWFSILVLLFVAVSSFGQNKVNWKVSTETNNNETFIVFKGKIEDHWHTYTQYPFNDLEGPLATTITYSQKNGIELIGKSKEYGMHKKFDEIFGVEIGEFTSKVTFKQKIKYTSSSAKEIVAGTIKYQVCKDGACMMENFDFALTVEKPANSNVEVSKDDSIEGTNNEEEIQALPEDTTLEFSIEDVISWTYTIEEQEKGKSFLLSLKPKLKEGFKLNDTPTFDFSMVEGLSTGNVDAKNGNYICLLNYEKGDEPIIPLTITYQISSSDSTIKNKEELLLNFKTATLVGAGTCETKVFDKNVEVEFSYWELMIEAFLWGLVSLLTPCVFPMIPMTVTYFMKGSKSKAKGRSNAILYGLFIILIYTLIGTIVAVVFGASFANWLATNWIPNVLFFIIFMVFAASFLGMFEIKLPSKLVNKSDQAADRGGILGIFFMALTLVLVSFSCTGPVVGIILIKAAQGDVLEPMLGMFAFSFAFALPFALFAFFPSLLKNLPKSGGWLNSVKVVLGLIEIALGLKFLSVADQTYHWGILDREIYIAIWIVVFTIMGLYLLGKIKFSHDSDLPYIKVPRMFLAIGIFSFVVYLIPGMWGAPLKSLAGYLPPMSTHDFDVVGSLQEEGTPPCGDEALYGDKLHLPHQIGGYFEYNQALQCAKDLEKPLFIDFTGHGCVNCREMEAKVWSDPEVLKMLKEDFVVVALYCDDKTELPENKWVVSKVDGRIKKTIGDINLDFQNCNFGNVAQPLYAILDNNGDLVANPKEYDLNVDAYKEWMKEAIKVFNDRKSLNNSKTLSENK